MNDYERRTFNWLCPYTGEHCEKDIPCSKCEVNKKETQDMEALDKTEYEEFKNGL